MTEQEGGNNMATNNGDYEFELEVTLRNSSLADSRTGTSQPPINHVNSYSSRITTMSSSSSLGEYSDPNPFTLLRVSDSVSCPPELEDIHPPLSTSTLAITPGTDSPCNSHLGDTASNASAASLNLHGMNEDIESRIGIDLEIGPDAREGSTIQNDVNNEAFYCFHWPWSPWYQPLVRVGWCLCIMMSIVPGLLCFLVLVITEYCIEEDPLPPHLLFIGYFWNDSDVFYTDGRVPRHHRLQEQERINAINANSSRSNVVVTSSSPLRTQVQGLVEQQIVLERFPRIGAQVSEDDDDDLNDDIARDEEAWQMVAHRYRNKWLDSTLRWSCSTASGVVTKLYWLHTAQESLLLGSKVTDLTDSAPLSSDETVLDSDVQAQQMPRERRITSVLSQSKDTDTIMSHGDLQSAATFHPCDINNSSIIQSIVNNAEQLERNSASTTEGSYVPKIRDTLCQICLQEYQPGDITALSSNVQCIHSFHLDCITDWLVHKPTCPACRWPYLSG